MQGVIFLDLTNKELIDLIKNNIDTINNFERLYKQNTGFIFQTIRSKVHGIYEVDDLMQESYLALVKAVEIYDNSREETNFLQILKWCVLNRVRNLNTRIPTHVRSLINKYKTIRNKLTREHGYEPDDDEMMTFMNIDYKKLVLIKQNLYECISLDDYLTDGNSTSRLDLIADENAHLIAQCNLETEDMKIKIKGAIGQLPYDLKKILEEVYFKEKSYSDIAKEQGFNEFYAFINLEKKALRLLRKNKDFLKQVVDYVRNDNINYYSRKTAEDIALRKIDVDVNNDKLLKKIEGRNIINPKLNNKIRTIEADEAFCKYALMGKPMCKNLKEQHAIDEKEFKDILAVEKIYFSSRNLVREILEIVYLDEPVEFLTKEEFLFRANKASFLTKEPISVIYYILKDIKTEFAYLMGNDILKKGEGS